MTIYADNFGLWETNPPLKLLHLPRSVLSSGQNRKNPKSRITYTSLVNQILPATLEIYKYILWALGIVLDAFTVGQVLTIATADIPVLTQSDI